MNRIWPLLGQCCAGRCEHRPLQQGKGGCRGKAAPHPALRGHLPPMGEGIEKENVMPRFSIIVPVYNVQNYLAACVKSVAEQAGERDWECILVDDGSTDMSLSLIHI